MSKHWLAGLKYAPDEQKPYTGWAKVMYENGQVKSLAQFKDGKGDGLWTEWDENGRKWMEENLKNSKMDGPFKRWYDNGQKQREGTYKNGKLWTCVAWKQNGEKSDTNIVKGNGVWVHYSPDGEELFRQTYKDGKGVED